MCQLEVSVMAEMLDFLSKLQIIGSIGQSAARLLQSVLSCLRPKKKNVLFPETSKFFSGLVRRIFFFFFIFFFLENLFSIILRENAYFLLELTVVSCT